MDKTIDDLLAAESVTADDLFVVSQNATAKKVSGDTLRRYLGAEKSPVVIDLYSAGVNADPAQLGASLSFDVSTDIVAQLVDAAKNGGALLKFGFLYTERLPVQAYFVGIALEDMGAYQLSGKAFFNSVGYNIFFDVQGSNARIVSFCSIDSQLPNPENVDDGAFLRVEGGKWVTSNVPAAEGGSF